MNNKLMKTLTPKVDFKKVEKNIEATEALVDVLHEPKSKKTTKTIEKKAINEPVIDSKSVKAPIEVASVADEPIGKEALRRLTVDVPVDIFLELRHKSINQFISMREYIINLIKQDLGR